MREIFIERCHYYGTEIVRNKENFHVIRIGLKVLIIYFFKEISLGASMRVNSK